MNALFSFSLVLVAGVCAGFAILAATLLRTTRETRNAYLLALSLLEGAYCVVAHEYLRRANPAEALPWGQSLCVFTPYITYFFGQLTLDLAGKRPRWLVTFQRVNLALTSLFSATVLVDMFLETSLSLDPWLHTDLETAHRHRLSFTPFGMGYLGWVTVAFLCFCAVLIGARRERRDLGPVIAGCSVYFVSAVSDFGILVGLYDAYFVQHFGFFGLVVGCFVVLAQRFERSASELREAVRRLEEQRRALLLAAPTLHKQKLDSLGTLAAGIAHEINNPIHVILNYAILLQKRLREDERGSSFAEEIEREAKRVAEIVRGLLRFGRYDDSEKVVADVRDVVDGTTTLVRALLPKQGISLEVSVAPDLPELRCRVQQLQQVLMNLVTNARDALRVRSIERREPKTIRIDVFADTRRGDTSIVFRVTDNGDGIDASVLPRIFDPFFTTKEAENGTGLGLSISHGIVESHGGTLACESEPGVGTTFEARIPCVPAPPASLPLDATG